MPFFKTTLELHRWLLCEAPENKDDVWWGKLIVGTSTLMFVLVIISGIIAWWPKKLRGLSKQMRIHTGRGVKRLRFDVYTIGGAYVSVFLLAITFTGLTQSFEWYRNGFYSIFGVKSESKNQVVPSSSQSKPASENIAQLPASVRSEEQKEFVVVPESSSVWQTVYSEVKRRQPDAASISINEEEASARFGSLGNGRASNTYAYDAETGMVRDVEYYTEAKLKQKVKGWVYSVYTGSWGGYLTRVLQFLAALLGAFLPCTGYYLWMKRSIKKSRK